MGVSAPMAEAPRSFVEQWEIADKESRNGSRQQAQQHNKPALRWPRHHQQRLPRGRRGDDPREMSVWLVVWAHPSVLRELRSASGSGVCKLHKLRSRAFDRAAAASARDSAV